ncbi:MAG: UMP kinase [Succinatimonas sp.]|jgi:uridylate kinase|nr:UMP kinase [Succinatimonas sp.]MDD5868624.1 UMP kinase [Succinatimonas sp.]MDY5721648.1 UMP kinase [Succinivibrio sp.]
MSSEQTSKPRRILLKVSGEALSGDTGFGIDPKVLSATAKAIRNVQEQGVQTVLVIGGGNIFRGAALQKAGFDRVTGDQMGMLATIMNGLAMREELKAQGGKCELMSAYGVPSITTQYSAAQGRELLNNGTSLIVAGGTGAPFFTTDTAAVLRAIELQCSEVLKATKVDGIYTADPVKDHTATKFDHLTFDEVIEKQLEVMDLTAFALARDHHMPIRVFSMNKPGAFDKAALGHAEGTVVSD